ncbi:hypothetical protein ACLMJK_008568 [Lecanora helva]
MSQQQPTTPVTEASNPIPPIAEPTTLPTTNDTSNQTSTSTSDVEEQSKHPNLPVRPRLGTRKSSGTMIVPADHPEIELKEETFPPNDARAMSPKRSSAETDRMIGSSRQAIQSHANELQSGLNALVEKVENIKSDHEKLEKTNNDLQEYIGGLTRSMSRTALDTGRKK